ncbi:MAG TPA: hypothetical protein PK098_01780 [Phycisphaerales bacterium]|nr:hypothetical protein [Phycisphaerales bacterium]
MPRTSRPIYAVQSIGDITAMPQSELPPERVVHLRQSYQITNLGTLIDVLV